MIASLLALLLLLAQETSRLELVAASGQVFPLRVKVADEPSEWSLGLTHRTELEPDAGMLFVFPTDVEYSFWMQNTHLPLSIAFIAADGRILGLTDMQPRTTDLHPPPGPYRYALEVNHGLFARNGIAVGDRIRLWVSRTRLALIHR